jgi:drug/metabolite transporter (DMT)-like permease
MRKTPGTWLRIGLLALIAGAVLLGLFRLVDPHTPITDAPVALIVVLALAITAFADSVRRRWRDGKGDADGKH